MHIVRTFRSVCDKQSSVLSSFFFEFGSLQYVLMRLNNVPRQFILCVMGCLLLKGKFESAWITFFCSPLSKVYHRHEGGSRRPEIVVLSTILLPLLSWCLQIWCSGLPEIITYFLGQKWWNYHQQIVPNFVVCHCFLLSTIICEVFSHQSHRRPMIPLVFLFSAQRPIRHETMWSLIKQSQISQDNQ